MVFTTVESSITRSGKALGIFKKDWHDVVFDIKNTTGLKNKLSSAFSSTISSNDIEAIKKYNNEIKNGVNPQSAFYHHIMKTSSATQNLVANANGAVVSEEALTIATNQLSVAQKAQALVSKAMGVALRTALNVGIMVAINLIITGITKLVNRQKELIEQAREAADEIKDEQKAVQDYAEKITLLREELDEENTTSERAIEIRKELHEIQDELIDNYDIERDKINLVTGDLEEQIKTLRELNKEKYKEAKSLNYSGYTSAVKNIQNASALLNLANGHLTEPVRTAYEEPLSRIGLSLDDMYNNGWGTSVIKLEADAYTIDEILKDIFDNLEKINTSDFSDNVVNQANYLKKSLSELRKQGVNETISENEEIYSQWLKNESDYSEAYYNLVRERVKVEYALEKDNAEEVAKAKQSFNNMLAEIVETANIAGDTDVVHFLNKEFAGIIKQATENPTDIDTRLVFYPTVSADVSKLQSSLDTVKEQIEDVFKNTNLFDKALESLNKGETISFDDVWSMVEIDNSLAGAFTKTADGYTIAADRLTEARSAYIQSVKEQLQADIASAKSAKTTAEENIKVWEKESAALEKAANYDERARQRKSELDAKIKEETENVAELNGVIDEQNLLLSELNNSAKLAKTSLDELTKSSSTLLSKMKTLSDAFKEQSENGKLSSETVLTLIENGYAAAIMYDSKTGAIRLNTEAYLKLAEAEYDVLIAELEIAKSDALEKRLEAQRECARQGALMAIDYATAWAELAKQQAIITDNDDLVKKLDIQIAALKQGKADLGKVTTGEYGNSSSNSSNTKPQSILDFEEWVTESEHKIAMGEMADDEKYYTEKLKRANIAYAGLTEYQSEFWKYQEEYYSWVKSQEKERHDNVIDNLKDEAKELEDKNDYDGAIVKYQSAIDKNNKKIDEYKSKPDGENIFKDEIDELTESNKDLYDDINSALIDKAEYAADNLHDLLDRGLIDWSEYKEGIDGIFADTIDINGESLLDNDFLDKYFDPDEEYDTRIAEWKKINGYDDENLEHRKALANYMAKLNDEIYGIDNPKKHAENQEDIDDFNEDTRVKAADEEIRYQEKLKAEVEDYYQTQIDALEKIQDETDKLAKKEELRLNLMKAEKQLLDAQKNKNQLVFSGGQFYYDVDQDAVISAQEEYDKSLKDIEDDNRQEEIDLLKEQKEQSANYYDTIIEILENYRDKVTPAESNPDVLNDAIEYEVKVDNIDDSKQSETVNGVGTSDNSKNEQQNTATDVSKNTNNVPNGTVYSPEKLWQMLGIPMPTIDTINGYVNDIENGILKAQNQFIQSLIQSMQHISANNNSHITINSDLAISLGLGKEQVQKIVDKNLNKFCDDLSSDLERLMTKRI